MPLRGESVGTAYVRVLADATGFPESLRDQINDDTSPIEDAGGTAAKTYKKAFKEEMDRDFGRELDHSFAEAVARQDATKIFFDDNEQWARFRKNVEARFGDVGREAADSMEEQFRRRGSLEGIEEESKRIVTRINDIWDEKITNENRIMDAESARVRKLGEDFRRFWFATDEETRKFVGSSGNNLDRNHSAFARFAVTVDHIGDAVGRAFGKGSRSELLNFVGSFIGNATKLIGLPARLLGNISEFTTGFRLAQQAEEGFFASLKAGFTNASAGAEGTTTALSSLISSGLVSIPLLVAALFGIVSVLGIVSSLITNIIAALIAMASTVSFAIVGALAPLAALLPALGLGIGTIVLGVATLDDKSKKALANAIKPLTNGLKDLGETAREGFLQTFNRGIDDMADKLRFLHPLVEAIGEGFGNVGNQIVDSFDSPTWRRFVNQFTRFIPHALESLGRSAGNLAGAFLAIFTDSIPVANRFLGWLEKITGEFQEFITSNPKKVTDFLESAADSAETLGDFLGAAARVLGDLLFSSAGKKSGDSIFDSLTSNLDKFDKFLDDHPDGVRDFFKNGEQTARDIGKLVLHIVDLFDAVNDPQSQKNLHSIFTVLNNISKLAPALAFLSNPAFFGAIGNFDWISDAVGQVRGLGRAIDRFKEKFTLKPGFAHGLVSWIPGAIGAIGGFVRRTGQQVHNFTSNFQLKPGFAHALVAWIPGAVGAIGGFVVRSNAAFNRAQSAAITSAHRLADGVVRFITSIPGRLGNLAGQFGTMAGNWAEAVFNQIVDLPGRIVGLFHGLAGRIMDAIGSINIPIHVSGPSGLHLPFTASGGIFDQAQVRVIGERGPEAVVPLTGPLDQIDASVRALAALARGQSAIGVGASAQTPGRQINVEQHIITPTADPVAAANEFVAHLVGAAI